jgi:hypothetical protein
MADLAKRAGWDYKGDESPARRWTMKGIATRRSSQHDLGVFIRGMAPLRGHVHG